MVLYLSIIGITAFVVALVNSLFLQSFVGASVWGIIGLSVLGIFISFCLDALDAIIVRKVPKEKFNTEAKFFKERKNERKLFEKLSIRKWKDRIPELGKTLKYFDKTKVEEHPTSEYMMNFIVETCYAETMHFVAIFTAPLLLVIFPFRFLLTISLPIVLVNIFLQILPIMVQRYTRPKLKIAYLRMKKQEK